MIIARDVSRYGEAVLRTGAAGYEIIVDGQFLMSSASGGSSRALIEFGLAALARPADIDVLIGGLGLGFSLRTALEAAAVAKVTVIEMDPAIIDWHFRDLIPGAARMIGDPRAGIIRRDFIEYIGECRANYDLIALDIDNGPAWLSHESNAALYTGAYLEKIKRRLTPGGVTTFWSADRAPEFKSLLGRFFNTVSERTYADHNGAGRLIPSFIYVAC